MKNLTAGTRIISHEGEMDCGVMSDDETHTERERHTGPNAEGLIFLVENWNCGRVYHVKFHPSEVWVVIEQDELSDATKYTIL